METYSKLYACNVIFAHFRVSLEIIFHPRHLPHSVRAQLIPTGPAWRSGSSRQDPGTAQVGLLDNTNTPTHSAWYPAADAVLHPLRAITWSLQVVWKLKRFRGCCGNYWGLTVAFSLQLPSHEMDYKHAGLSPHSPACAKLCPEEVF